MKKKLLTLVILFTFLGISCSDDEPARGGFNENGFTLSYKVNEPASVITRSGVVAEEEENRINSFYILFFERTSDGTGRFVEAIDALANSGSLGSSLAATGDISITFSSGSRLNKTTDYNILFCANIDAYAKDDIAGVESLNTLCDGRTESEVNTLLLEVSGVNQFNTEEGDDSNRMASTNLPMSGSAVKRAADEHVTAELVRMVSRFDLFCNVAGYELVSASIWNAATTSPVWNDYTFDFTPSYTERYYGVNAENRQIVGSLYAFENLVAATVQNDAVTTCLIVGLKNSQGTTEFFRVNVKADIDNTQNLKRNHIYRTIIQEVKGTGQSTERAAYTSGAELLDVDINGWFTGEGGNVQIKDGNVLAVPTQHIKLYAHGDQRTYYIYTLGTGSAHISQIYMNGGVSDIMLRSSGEDANILKRYELLVTAGPGTIEEHNPSYVTISFGGMTSTIYITQELSLGSYLTLTPADHQYFSRTAPQSSGNITVNSSGKWKAKVYNGDYFSFQSGGSVKEISGVSGDRFNVHTIESNPGSDSRYSFVLVYLEDMPSVSETIVLQQYGDSYIIINPSAFDPISGGGGSTPNITVSSSGPWKASVTINRGTAYFEDAIDLDAGDGEDENNDNDNDEDETGPVEWSGVDGDAFILTLAGLDEPGGITPTATVTLTLVGNESVKNTFTVNQKTLSAGSLIIQTRRDTRAGSVFNLNKAVTYNFVYNLATNMRNTNLFGPGGVVEMDEEYIFMKSKKIPLEVTNIFQITGYPSTTVYKNTVTPWWQADEKRFLFFSDYDVRVRYALRYFQAGNSGVSGYDTNSGNLGVAATVKRYFNSDLDPEVNKLVAYMLKDGPFAQNNGHINPEEIQLQSKNATSRGLEKWPNTFIPLIMVNKGNKKYCVFGIDPTNRLIILTDPGIFGCRPNSNFPNSTNFDSEANQKFMNNFIAWMTRAASEGESFYKQFQVGN
ncbi:MAG: hypothetical protein LUG51_10725 [Tannerellaceae bacterium]|nr:hypothetical protein [Tannerellaceae bacterium]